MIKINKIKFKNFKVFGAEPYCINFEDSRLILLDGPNGYGKTSVFDAIELGLTGKIRRLITLDDRQYPDDIVVAHQGAENVEIELEFKSEDSNSKIFQRKLKNPVPKSSKKISKFAELWELNEIVDGISVPSNQSELDRYFNCKDFARDFLLFHYVQQEDTALFLKTNNESKRADELSQLFGNTGEADQKLYRLKDFYKKLMSAKRTAVNRVEEINRIYKIDENVRTARLVDEQHFYVLPWLADISSSPFWDTLNIPELNDEKLNKSLSEIISVKKLVEYQNYYLRKRRFESAIQQREIIELYVGYYNVVNEYDSYALKSQEYQLIENSYPILKSGDLVKINSIDNIKFIIEILDLSIDAGFETELQSLLDLEKKANGLNSIYSELLKHHDYMARDIKKIPDVALCLLCGHDYQSHDTLTNAIAQHGDLLRSELSVHDKHLVKARDDFNHKYLFSLVQACSSYLEKTIAPSQEDLFSLSKALQNHERLTNLRNWLVNEEVQHDELILETFPIIGGPNKISEAADHLCERILASIGDAPEGYYEANGSNNFDRIYRDYFQNSKNKLAGVRVSQLEEKEDYVKKLYFSSMKEVKDELDKLLRQIDLFGQAADDVSRIINTIGRKVKQYRKKLITDIEIPFYIYSGKILQTHQAGMGHGILIKDPKGEDELKNVRLVSNWDSDHDILNTMSSGQVSAVVIALTLALNKVYAKRFSSILIDDPVQTMDEINMSSLVEVLRNDFCEKQIILSTHEDKVARYFTYKYLKYGKHVRIINLMQRKEYVPRNKFLYTVNDADLTSL
ncbi:hypothetical protein GCM10011382_19710 [Vreelandella lutescens]|uniref:RecF/RecN/SMC N-terminal domain-containing protein n=1 Tax=Vreelandella lutescens TaxID=1602943 RepID=A0ABQ1P248_9GAMM|nr:hypothetical protein GCM10011382_19710 [Halomonas lutescens]